MSDKITTDEQEFKPPVEESVDTDLPSKVGGIEGHWIYPAQGVAISDEPPPYVNPPIFVPGPEEEIVKVKKVPIHIFIDDDSINSIDSVFDNNSIDSTNSIDSINNIDSTNNIDNDDDYDDDNIICRQLACALCFMVCLSIFFILVL